MQSKTTRGVRHLLVSAGVISLVLSVAAPSALAAKPEDKPGNRNPHSVNTETGTTRTLVCHEGRVIEVDDDGALAGHTKHGDDILDGGAHEVGVECVNEGDVITDEDGPLEDEDQSSEHDDDTAGQDDEETSGQDDDETAGQDDEETSGQDDEKTSGQDSKDEHDPELEVDVESGAEEKPAAVPVPAGPKPVIVISTDSVTKPTPPVAPAVPAVPAVTEAPAVPASPAAPAAAPTATPNRGNEVLGSVTTRTPGVAASTVTRTGVTALAATGTSTTTVLAILGSVLLLAGLGLQLVGRRHGDGSALGA